MIYSEKVIFREMQQCLVALCKRGYRIVSVFPYEVSGMLNSKYTEVVVIVYEDKE